MIPRVLTIASSDSGGGAGIQADLKAFARCGAHGMSAIVALTAQNTLGVTSIAEQSAEFVRDQIRAVLDDIGADAAKTGMLFSSAIIEAVADELAGRRLPLVVDPVMVASSGSRLLLPDAVATLTGRLFPLATVVTPNLPEAQALTGLDTEDRAVLAERLVAMGAGAALVTGGHGATPADHLFDGQEHLAIPVARHDIAATHGAGCTHSAALAAGLAAGLSLADAARQAAAVAGDAVAHGLAGLGGGDGPVHVLRIACGGATPLHPPAWGGFAPPYPPHGRTPPKTRRPPRCGCGYGSVVAVGRHCKHRSAFALWLRCLRLQIGIEVSVSGGDQRIQSRLRKSSASLQIQLVWSSRRQEGVSLEAGTVPEKAVISHRGEKYEIGRGKRFYGIWVVGAPYDAPVDRWPENRDGWQQAWARFATIEEPGTIEAVTRERKGLPLRLGRRKAGDDAERRSATAAAAVAGRRSRRGTALLVGEGLLVLGVVLGLVGLFPAYVGSQSLLSQWDQVVPHLLLRDRLGAHRGACRAQRRAAEQRRAARVRCSGSG